MLHYAVEELTGPVAVRYPRGSEGRYRACCGDEAVSILREGTDCTLVSYGVLINEALDAADILQKKGISAKVVKLNHIAPLQPLSLDGAFRGTKCLLVLEDCVRTGCVGQHLAAELLQLGICPSHLILKNAGDVFVPQGNVDELYRFLGIDARSVAQAIEEVLHER